MRLQSDIEVLLVHAMEEYVDRKHVTGADAIDLFHRHQVSVIVSYRKSIEFWKIIKRECNE